MKTEATRYFKVPTPILDLDMQDDLYLDGLISRARAARYDASRHDAVLDWIN